VNQREFRLDFFIAIFALLVSVLTSLTLLYQTRIIGQQYAATIWPYLSSDVTVSPTSIAAQITNDGVGPALIQSAELIVDGKGAPSWDAYFKAILAEHSVRAYFESIQQRILAGKPFPGSMETASLAPGSTLRPGDVVTLMRLNLPGAPMAAIVPHKVDFRLCYCSLNKSCWILDTTLPFGKETRPVGQCSSTASIGATAFRSPSVPLRRR